MSIPILAIPEAAFDASAYNIAAKRRNSSLLQYILRLTKGSAAALVVAYLVGYFALRPLMEKAFSQRLELLEACRGSLRDLYLNAIGRVSYIPIVAISKNDGSGKLYADAVCQTEDVHKSKEEEDNEESLGMRVVVTKLKKLLERLNECLSFQVDEFPHYKVIDYALKDLRQKTDLVFFDQRKLFSGTEQQKTPKPVNLAHETRNEIRNIKGMYMSGQA